MSEKQLLICMYVNFRVQLLVRCSFTIHSLSGSTCGLLIDGTGKNHKVFVTITIAACLLIDGTGKNHKVFSIFIIDGFYSYDFDISNLHR